MFSSHCVSDWRFHNSKCGINTNDIEKKSKPKAKGPHKENDFVPFAYETVGTSI